MNKKSNEGGIKEHGDEKKVKNGSNVEEGKEEKDGEIASGEAGKNSAEEKDEIEGKIKVNSKWGNGNELIFNNLRNSTKLLRRIGKS